LSNEKFCHLTKKELTLLTEKINKEDLSPTKLRRVHINYKIKKIRKMKNVYSEKVTIIRVKVQVQWMTCKENKKVNYEM
jgi:hypothetical protein